MYTYAFESHSDCHSASRNAPNVNPRASNPRTSTIEIIAGIIAAVAIAATSPHSVPAGVTSPRTAIGTVEVRRPVSIIDIKNSFQLNKKENTTVVAKPGRIALDASRIVINIESPSTEAASTNDCGSSSKNPLSIHTANPRLRPECASVNPNSVSTRPTLLNTKNNGSASAAAGAMRADRNKNNRRLRPGRKDKPKAAGIAKMTAARALPVATSIELTKCVPNSS